MQTFLPHPNFAVSAHVLDRARLGKQRVECGQIVRALRGGSGWVNHPVVKMWSGHLPALCLYMSCVIREWERRGYENSMVTPYNLVSEEYLKDVSFHAESLLPAVATDDTIVMPAWLGDESLHAAHRSRLLERDPEWYGQWGWNEYV